MDRETYLGLIRDLLSGDPGRVRAANQVLFRVLVGDEDVLPMLPEQARRAADLVLAEVP